MKIKFNKLWDNSKKIIPGGNMLYSKRAEMFLPGNNWPTYFYKSKGCYLWDKNKKKYIDMIFAVGTNVLGYSNKQVDNIVKKNIDKGNMTTLNCFEEVELAKELLKINRWAGMVKFARSGGEANAISIRIARAYNNINKQNIAACGYHGWHDWYLSSNLNNKKNLDNFLMKKVEILGVEKNLKNTIFLFNYNDTQTLEKLLKTKKIGIIKMEVERTLKPKNNFLKKVRKLANKYKAILIFDECTSGFRETYGGLHQKYKVYPDIITYGKALGNGFAITAILGKKKIMNASNKTFISSTFWSERIGFVASLATLKIMKRKKTFNKIKKIGKLIKKNWLKIAKKNNLKIFITGIDAIPQFTFNENHQYNKTFLTQEMLKKGYLASNIIYISIAHTNKILNKYFVELDKIFYKIKMNKNLLDNKVAHSEFKRLN